MTELDTLPDELILNIHSKDKTSPENMTVTLNGREISEPAFAFKDEKFIQTLEQLEKMIRLPLPCDAKGIMSSKQNDLEMAVYEHAVTIGTGLASILDDTGRQTLADAMNRNTIPLLRIVAGSDWADSILSLPWELLYIDGRFPVKEARLDVVREVNVANVPGFEPQTTAFRVLLHIAAPEDDEGQNSLAYEEEAYRLVLSMQQATKDAVAFSDLGTVRDLVRAVRHINPTVVHFAGHGSPGTLLFENENGEIAEILISDFLTEMRSAAVDKQPVLPQVIYLASCYGASGTPTSTPIAQGYRLNSELSAVKGKGPSTATTLQREGCPAIVAYFGPAGDQLSTRAETAFYSGLASGKRLTESVRSARLVMAGVLGEKDHNYRYPLGWAQLALYLRGNDIPITKGKTAVKVIADDIYALGQELYRSKSPVHSLDMLHSGIGGFIGRRKDLAMLRQSHVKGQRMFVLYGINGIGKTALAVNLIPKLRIDQDKIIVLDAARAVKAANPAQDLWEQMTDQLQDGFPDILASLLETHKRNQNSDILLGAMIANVKEPWLIYLDNAESLQLKPDSENSDSVAWGSSEIATWWQILASGAVHGGSLTLIATTRYLLKELERKNSFQVGLLRADEIARMMRWFPYLRQIPCSHKKKIVEWLNGHAQTLIYLEGLFKEILDPLKPEDEISEARWKAAIKDAMYKTDAKPANEDLMLSHILKRLDDTAKDQLRILTALRCPAPLDAVKTFGDQTQRLESLGLIKKFSGRFYGMHDSVNSCVKTLCGPALPKDHLCIGLWYKDTFKTEKRLVFAEEALYHLIKAKKAD
ncbi:MAG: CHAT domain-containing protein, partial [Proteobacteria bacterium]|nr:CHAT domain-containing protein [Pseudomonadota bacterium]